MTREEIEQAAKLYGENHRIPYEGDIVDFAIQQVNAALVEAADLFNDGRGASIQKAIRALKIT
jgi:hypothetical protein